MSVPSPQDTPDVRPARLALYEATKSIKEQLTVCRTIAERQGWVQVGTLRSAARSGAMMIGRPGPFDMLAAACEGEFEVVLVEDLSRLSRSASPAGHVQNELMALGVTVHSADVGVTRDGSS